ncbi:MAG: ATP-binding cassette domain-containing protein [Actinomycetaceae bacterium]|nr:ATP-binding cassette domain-containing protein [Actinomycetaceae bacterium]
MSLLQMNNLSKTYDSKKILENLYFCVNQHDVVWLSAPSGTGKTTLLRIAGLLEKPDAGSVVIAGEQARTQKQADMIRARYIGMAFQNSTFIGHMSVRDNLEIACIRKDDVMIDELLVLFGLDGIKKSKVRDISGGEAQRLLLCRALVNRPSVLLIDEPTSALDDANARVVFAQLEKIQRVYGCAMVIASHDARLADIATRRVVLDNGVVEEK